MPDRAGPLSGVKIVELTGIGPVPYAAMIMADLGAEVIRIDRPGGYPAPDPLLDFAAMDRASIFYRSRPMIRVDLKSQAGKDLVMRLIGTADAVIEGYRPGTMERLGLGP
ncbi:MAG TPA: carnitine dehydratase, partial [Rhodospirillaceae bacterium]|nr:carnitine dehydratase [Rhodospirillaceae bacterium]